MIPEQYVWLGWASAFLLPWLAAFALFPKQRNVMLWASLLTMPLGLTEPLFIPAYWTPPSLFDLAQNTGFDIESLIFSFAIGGIGATLYDLVTRRETAGMPVAEQSEPRHRLHAWALAVPFISFPLLYLLPWNPIYPAIVAMALGALAALFCRPDLAWKICFGGLLFLVFYALFLLGMEWTAPAMSSGSGTCPRFRACASPACQSRNSYSPRHLALIGQACTSISLGADWSLLSQRPPATQFRRRLRS
jgi:hypothetical protein